MFISVASSIRMDKILVTLDVPKFILEENDAVTLG